MSTSFVTSPDGTCIAYETCGTGPAVMLLHGGGSSRQEWHEAGYVERLSRYFKVIMPDLRGHGESDSPTDPSLYTPEKMGQDFLAVAGACGVDRFSMWGMSFGGKIGRYLAVQCERVSKMILMGTPMGAGVSGKLRQDAVDFCAHWPPIIQAQRDGTLDLASLSPEDREFMNNFNVPAMLGWVRAMLDWPVVTPADFRCPTLWIIGSEDRNAMESLKQYQDQFKDSNVQVWVVEGVDHSQVFDEIDKVFEVMLAFTR